MCKNNAVFNDYYTRLKNLAINMFEWTNLPPSVDERFLELTLFEQGYCLFFYDEDLAFNESTGYIALTCTFGSPLNVYRIPTQYRAYSVNGYNRSFDITNSVLVFNNYLRMPTSFTVDLFAKRLYEIERSIDVNVKTQKTPVLIRSSEEQRLVLQNLYMQYDGNEPFIFGDKSLDINGISAINTGAPYVADKLTLLKHQVWNEALTFLGIRNSNTDKKERLITDEVIDNNGDTDASRFVMLDARRQAADQINRMFGLNIGVRFRDGFNVSRETSEGDETIEQVYNGTTMDYRE